MYNHSLSLNTRRSVLSVIDYSIVDLLFDIIKFIFISFINSSLFVLSIQIHLDSHVSVVSVNCISFISYSFSSEAATSEEILQHLHSLHLQDPIPRFCKGRYCKASSSSSSTSIPLLSKPLLTGTLPHSLFQSSYHISSDFVLPGLHTDPLSLQLPSKNLKLKSYDIEFVDSSCVVLNCGNGVVSSSMFNGYLAVSCVDNQYGLLLPHRSFQSTSHSISNYDNIITLYSLSTPCSIKPLLHIIHHHSYAIQLCWIPIPDDCNDIIGLLGCVYVDGSVDILSVDLLNRTNSRFLKFILIRVL